MKRAFRSLAFCSSLAVPSTAFAAIPSQIYIYCGGLPGCPSGFVEKFSSVLRLLLLRMPEYVYVACVVFVLIGGAYILLSAGRDDMVTKGKTTIIWAVAGAALATFAESIVGFIVLEVETRTPGTDLITSAGNTIVTAIFDLLYISILCVAVYCGMQMVMSFGKEDQFGKGREGLFWCAVGAIIINLADAITRAFLTL